MPHSIRSECPNGAKPDVDLPRIAIFFSEPPDMMRKTRFVCVSDTHAYNPSEAGFKLPAGDVLIHAGDLTTHGSLSELRNTLDWISAADYEVKIIIAGNHDITLDSSFYDSLPAEQKPETSPQQSLSLLAAASSSIVFLTHQSALIRLTRPNGPNTLFKVFGSPYSPAHSHGSNSRWSAFGYESTTDNTITTASKEQNKPDDDDDTATAPVPKEGKDDATKLWNQIPSDTDILITHTPPYALCDRHSRTGSPVGCKALRRALGRVRPSLAVCGHVHEARGCARLLWEGDDSYAYNGADNGNGLRMEQAALPPRGSRKQSLVDLTGRRGRRLRNWGFAFSSPDSVSSDNACSDSDAAATVSRDAQLPGKNVMILPSPLDHVQPCCGLQAGIREQGEVAGEGENERAQIHPRRETCLVNAAILATSFPHRGGKQFNVPVVVDLELPTWRLPEPKPT